MNLARMMSLRPTPYVDFHAADQDGAGQDPPPWTQKTKIVAPEGEVSTLLLAWSGLHDVWHTHDLGRDRDFFNDVVMLCDGTSLDVEAKDEHALMPEDIYAIYIDDPGVARDQMVKAIETLIAGRDDA